MKLTEGKMMNKFISTARKTASLPAQTLDERVDSALKRMKILVAELDTAIQRGAFTSHIWHELRQCNAVFSEVKTGAAQRPTN
jgi:hypothetical protein